jgi:hypothetical protein
MSGADFAIGESIPMEAENFDAVAKATDEVYFKVAEDLYADLFDSPSCSHLCADAARKALLGTGWERFAKVKDVAQTVYYVVKNKLLCGETAAVAARNWVNSNLNSKIQVYIYKPDTEPGYAGQEEVRPTPKIPSIPLPTWIKPNSGPVDPETAPGVCPRGRQYQAPIFGGCDPGYYREKTWGRDLCICEEGASAATWYTDLAGWASGNIKLVMILFVVLIVGMVLIKLASKKVSVG